MCFVLIWEQTAIIFLYNIDWFLLLRRSVFTARYGLGLQIAQTQFRPCSVNYVQITSLLLLLVFRKFAEAVYSDVRDVSTRPN